jgi:hypothetical protein
MVRGAPTGARAEIEQIDGLTPESGIVVSVVADKQGQ